MKHLTQRKVARVLFDECHNESWTIDEATARRMQPNHPADSSYVLAAKALCEREFVVERNTQPLTPSTLSQADALVIAHPSDTKWEHTTATGSPLFSEQEIAAIHAFVREGGGLIVMGETEQDKYGNNVNDLLCAFGIRIENATLTDHAHCHNNVPSWVLGTPTSLRGEGLVVEVNRACFLRAGVLSVSGEARLALQASSEASTPHAGLVAMARCGQGYIVVFADSDLFGDDDLHQFDHKQLWLNAVYWAAQGAFARHSAREVSGTLAIPIPSAWHLIWQQLKQATNALRTMQKADGALAESTSHHEARALVAHMRDSITALQPHFPHQQTYLDCILNDLQTWADGGFAKPDFTNSLAAFRPELKREDDIEHLVVFPLYTPNGSPETKFEALLVRTPWPAWLAELERAQFDNAKFVPLHFVDHTDGYTSECAVLFPETVSVAGKPTNNFGGIFCDREAARYQRVVGAACQVMQVNIPPQVSSFLKSADLIRDTFALWDLIHDRWHSHGELPFDPFMIRQRLPYWMYSLEELRVDLQTYGSAIELERAGFAFARYVKYGILFDRIFRFPITGNRVRNYDGLGGQLLFAFLHKHGVAQWRDNALTIDWARLDETVAALRERVEQLYRDGIDSTKVQYWLAAHDLVSEWVKPNLGSKWAKETRTHGVLMLSDESKPKDWIDRVLDDEFPLSLFYLQLQKKLQSK